MSTNTLQQLQITLAENIRTRRKLVGISQEQLALDAEIDRTYISQIERAIGNPSLLVLHKIANRLNVTVAALLTASSNT